MDHATEEDLWMGIPDIWMYVGKFIAEKGRLIFQSYNLIASMTAPITPHSTWFVGVVRSRENLGF
jgi:hypothetical protein